MSKNKEKEPDPQEKLDKLSTTFSEIKEQLEKYDSLRHAIQSIERMLNWFLAISSGFLIAIFSSIDKYKIENKIPFKGCFLIGIVMLTLSIITLFFARFSYYVREAGILVMKGKIEKIGYKVKRDDKSVDEDIDKIDEYIDLWVKSVNIASSSIVLVQFAISFMIIGIITFIAYYLTVIIKYF